jgi:hypothetical protein
MQKRPETLPPALPRDVPDYYGRQAAHCRALASCAPSPALRTRLLREAEAHEEIAQGEMAQGEMAQGEMAQGEMAQGEMAQGEMAQGETGPEETAEAGERASRLAKPAGEGSR